MHVTTLAHAGQPGPGIVTGPTKGILAGPVNPCGGPVRCGYGSGLAFTRPPATTAVVCTPILGALNTPTRRIAHHVLLVSGVAAVSISAAMPG